MSDIAIHLEDLSKKYRLGTKQKGYQTFRDTLTEAVVAPFRRIRSGSGGQASTLDNTVWALKDVSFDIKCGEVVGIIGNNGAGKSTLLKILSRITEPTAGFADIRGRVSSLLEVGSGFHHELTGRENIALNGAILGMKRTEIKRQFDEIVSFAEVEKFIDTPVKHYSSGMYLRLAFAVAAHLQPEVLLVDEVLAVGDAAFQKKCLGKMGEVAKEGRTVLFVSHNMGAIGQLCTRALLIEDGRLKLTGIPSDVVTSYISSGATSRSTWTPSSNGCGNGEFEVKSARVLSENNQPTVTVEFDKPCKVEITYDVLQSTKDLSLICRLTDAQGNILWTSWDTDTTDWKGGYIRNPGRYTSLCKIPPRLLRPGLYQVSISARNSNRFFDYHDGVLAFDVTQVGYNLNPGRVGMIVPVLDWEIRQVEVVN